MTLSSDGCADKHGLKSVMYWIPTDEARKDNTLIYVLVHESQDAADRCTAYFGSPAARYISAPFFRNSASW